MDTIDIGRCVGTLCTFLHLFLEATHTGDGPLVSPMLQTGLGLRERRGSPGSTASQGQILGSRLARLSTNSANLSTNFNSQRPTINITEKIL